MRSPHVIEMAPTHPYTEAFVNSLSQFPCCYFRLCLTLRNEPHQHVAYDFVGTAASPLLKCFFSSQAIRRQKPVRTRLAG
jgi:hypothetical protein